MVPKTDLGIYESISQNIIGNAFRVPFKPVPKWHLLVNLQIKITIYFKKHKKGNTLLMKHSPHATPTST